MCYFKDLKTVTKKPCRSNGANGVYTFKVKISIWCNAKTLDQQTGIVDFALFEIDLEVVNTVYIGFCYQGFSDQSGFSNQLCNNDPDRPP